MSHNHSWMHMKGMRGRLYEVYTKGVQEFLEFVFKDASHDCELLCPCRHCQNRFTQTYKVMKVHLMRNDIEPTYNPWTFHGKGFEPVDEEIYEEEEDNDSNDEDSLISSDKIVTLVHEATNVFENVVEKDIHGTSSNVGRDDQDELPGSYQRLIKAEEKELYLGCKNFSKLEFIVNLLHQKVNARWSEKTFLSLLSMLHKSFNYDPSFPKNSHEARKYTRDLGLNYVKIHACVNHCILYRKEHVNADVCSIFNEPRWEEDVVVEVDDSGTFTQSQDTPQRKSRIPRLVLRYFPITPKLQRLFICNRRNCKHVKILRHPADSQAWKKFDESHTNFALDPRNVRLGLATYCFTPGGHLGTKYNIWLVFLVPYNLPPLMLMRSPYIMMSLLIPGPKSPGNDIDVFLEPLIDELKDLWDNGAVTYDASSKKKFNMKAALLWTISDFPSYASLSIWSTCGKLACPWCGKDTSHSRLHNWGKECFMCHHRFLEPDHKWRHNKKSFIGEKERRCAPEPLSGDEL